LRYFLLADVVFGKDGTYSAEAIVTKTNADLANNFGNLAQRSLSMIAKNCEGKVPPRGEPTEAEQQLLSQLDICFSDVKAAVTGGLFKIDQALDIIRERLSATNTYFADQAPWALRKTDPARADSVLYHTAEAIRQLAIMLRWVMPESCDRMLDLLAQSPDARDFEHLVTPIEAGLELPAPIGVFPRLELPKDEPEA
jgi:methionyl-tRNA synthetase